MWRATLVIGVLILIVGLAIVSYADHVSSWRARVYGEPEQPPGFFVTRGGVLTLIGVVIAVLAFLHP